MNLKEQRVVAMKAGQDYIDGIRSREKAGVKMTQAESDEAERLLDVIRGIDAQLDEAAKSSELMGRLQAQVPQDGGGEQAGMRLSLSGKGASALAVKAANAMRGEYGSKALAPSGAAVVGQEFVPDPIALGQPATGLLDLLPVVAHNAPEFAYLRQSTRTNAAAVVAAGAVKPTSTYGLERIEDSLRVVAHLSEAVPQYWIADNAALQQFIGSELSYGLRLAVEALVLSTIDATSGIQTQAYVTNDLLATTRTSITMVEAVGYQPSAFVLRPEDWQTIELSRADTSGVFDIGSAPVDRAAQRLWGVPVALSTAPAAKAGYLLSGGAVALDTDTSGVKIEWSSAVGDDWQRNQIRARVEGRYAAGVRQPMGVVKIATAA